MDLDRQCLNIAWRYYGNYPVAEDEAIIMRHFSCIFFAVSFLLLSMPAVVLPLTTSEVEKSLICYKCPGEPLNIDRCSRGDQMRAIIEKMIGEGKTKEEMLAYFVSQYGESILTIPPKRGFNLVVYIAPFLGLLIGVVVAFVFVRRWATSGRRDALTKSLTGDDDDEIILSDELQRKVDDELKKLEEE